MPGGRSIANATRQGSNVRGVQRTSNAAPASAYMSQNGRQSSATQEERKRRAGATMNQNVVQFAGEQHQPGTFHQRHASIGDPARKDEQVYKSSLQQRSGSLQHQRPPAVHLRGDSKDAHGDLHGFFGAAAGTRDQAKLVANIVQKEMAKRNDNPRSRRQLQGQLGSAPGASSSNTG